MDKTTASCCSCGSSCCRPADTRADIRTTTSGITLPDQLDHALARWGWNRMGHIVEPGLYRLGEATPDSPVFVSANYTLSFDAVRSALAGHDAWILVLDTKGINVWCAAGKGTFGTDEIVRRIDATGLHDVVRHRALIVPQLGAPGVSAHGVLGKSGFRVEYGPVRARDLPEFLKNGHAATEEMRRVRFTLADRLAVAPVEVVAATLPTIAAAVVLYLLAGPVGALAAIAAVLAGTVLFPALLPYLPTKDFSTKGLVLGALVALPFVYASIRGLPIWAAILSAAVPLLLMPAVTAYLALNFTGSTTFTSRTGVKKEIFRYVPLIAVMVAGGALAGLALVGARLVGAI